MNKTKFLFASALCALMSMSFVGCDNNDDPTPDGPTAPTETLGVYILNSGKFKSNNATLDAYNAATKLVTKKVFSTINERGLGDTANDMLVYGSKMYIAVDVSNTIEITDLAGKSLKTISPKDDAGQPQSPRYLAAYNGKVYVTLFDGHLASIDTTQMEITQKTKVGPNPYQVCPAGGKLYVANSGGYNPVPDSTLSVVDPITFKEEKKIVVGPNPTTVKVDRDGDLYVVCLGIFGKEKASARRVDLKTSTSTSIYQNDNILMNLNGDQLYILSSESDAAYLPTNTKFIMYDAKAEKELKANFITDKTKVVNPCFINIDPVAGDIYMGSSDYTTTGDVYVFSSEGKLINQFGVSGINPMGAYFITNK